MSEGLVQRRRKVVTENNSEVIILNYKFKFIYFRILKML